jgi:pimeloyl-ACP methyl ester carboxylesterase
LSHYLGVNHWKRVSEQLQIRIHGNLPAPTLIYLPGMHGDWTLAGGLRRALTGRVRFVEFTYPRTLEWSLEDYAHGVEDALREHGVVEGWLLGESFGSQVVWPLIDRRNFPATGVILVGGFARHPMCWAVRLVERIVGGISLSLITRILFGYAKIARFRYRHSPETLAGLQEFIARRTELDRQAATHRLRLMARNDPNHIVRQMRLPLYALSGLIDPIVPWFLVRPWLRRHCPALREYKIIWCADHNVLATAPEAAAEQLLRWINSPSAAQATHFQRPAAQGVSISLSRQSFTLWSDSLLWAQLNTAARQPVAALERRAPSRREWMVGAGAGRCPALQTQCRAVPVCCLDWNR